MTLPLMSKLVRPGSWGHKLLGYGLPLLLVAFTANHVEYWFRHKRASAPGVQPVVVRAEKGFLPGHRTIGIDEASTSPDGELFLRFTTLGQWEYDPKSPSPCPRAVQELSGRDISCIGFMYPLEAGSELKTFCLLRSTQTCCYGPRPQYNQYLLVEMKSPVTFERLTPVIVKGKFYPDPQPEQGYIYRMEGKSVTPVRDEQPDLDPVEAAKSSGLPLFDFALLSEAQNQGASGLPRELLSLEGKRVLVAGYLLDRQEGPAPQVLVGKDWWDGVSKGKPPTIYDAVAVFAQGASEMPPVWKERGLFAGTLHVETDPKQWSNAGIVSLHQATRRLGADKVKGYILKPAYEVVMFGILMALGLWGLRSRGANGPKDGLAVTPVSRDGGES